MSIKPPQRAKDLTDYGDKAQPKQQAQEAKPTSAVRRLGLKITRHEIFVKKKGK